MSTVLAASRNFYPRPPRGGRRAGWRKHFNKRRFLSTPSARRATADSQRVCWQPRRFLSTPSARRATQKVGVGRTRKAFLSTPSARRATCFFRMNRKDGELFLSTPSARRATWWLSRSDARSVNFYPRPPRGGRRNAPVYGYEYPGISIHALREEGDSKNRDKISIFKQIIQHSARI